MPVRPVHVAASPPDPRAASVGRRVLAIEESCNDNRTKIVNAASRAGYENLWTVQARAPEKAVAPAYQGYQGHSKCVKNYGGDMPRAYASFFQLDTGAVSNFPAVSYSEYLA
jgi:hypothetical protein